MFGRNWYRGLASRYATHRRRRRSPVRRPAFRSRLCEPLECRRLLSITVDTLVDEADGSIVDGDVSLRDAIALAAPGDTIDFSVTGTIMLTLGELTVDKQLTIVGPGADLLTIDASGNDPTPDENNGDGSRVFSVDIAAPALPTGLSLSGLTLTGGDATNDGGAIRSFDAITLSGMVISDNSATARGGGVYVTSPSSIVDTVFSNNSATDGGGLCLFEPSGTRTNLISDTTFVGNVASRFGGGLFNITNRAELTVSDSTFYDNLAKVGGGIYNLQTFAVTKIVNTTISGNTATDSGGGIRAYSYPDGDLTLENVTITGNVANGTSSGTGGGGLFNNRADAPPRIVDTIIAGNVAGPGASAPDVWSSIRSSYSLIGVDTGSSITDEGGSLIGTAATPIDPMLGPLADNGGPTQTHALLPGSPAIDAGAPAFMAPPYTDQRGYYRVIDGDGDMTARIDIGAYEYGSVPPLPGDGNLDGLVDGNDYLIWASFFGDDPAQDPPGSPLNGDFNGDGTVDGLDYILWAENYGQAVSTPLSIASAVVDAPQVRDAQVVDAALDGDYDTGSLVTSDPQARDWQISRAFDSVLKQTAGRHAGQRRLDWAL